MIHSSFGFIITRDYCGGGPRGTVGPSNVSNDVWDRLTNGEGSTFRMKDDDGKVCYSGRCIHDGGEEMFLPLDCFGTPNVGCTTIEYKNENGEWEMT